MDYDNHVIFQVCASIYVSK